MQRLFSTSLIRTCVCLKVQQVQHVYQSQVQYVEGAEAVYPNGTM